MVSAETIATTRDSCAAVSCSVPTSSPLDTRSYRACVLPNALRVLLVSDPVASKAGAAMDVAVGHFADPDDLPGLAHFLEHMLFLGTEKYPEEDSYRTFLAENGGHSNAYTAMENTNYHFSVIGAHLDGALDRFAQFFIAPLFTESATDREMNAVDSEHQKNLQSDAHRIFQLHKSLAAETHPFNKFGTGSRKTLDKPHVRDALLAFHKKWYSANLMALCVVGPQTLDTLQNWVEAKFASIPNRNTPLPSTEILTPGPVRQVGPYPDAMGPHRIFVTSIKDLRYLELGWVIPPFHSSYKTKPGHFVAHLVGHEGRGSLLSLLKEKGWVDSLAAGPTKSADTFGTFEVNMELTAEGLGHENEIINLVFAYLGLIEKSGIEKWIFDEVSATADMGFRFQEREDPMRMSTRLAADMRFVNEADYLSAPFRYFDFDPEQVRETLSYLKPDRVWVTLVGKHCEKDADDKEKWYQTPYRIEKIGKQDVAAWETAQAPPELFPPPPNKFIPTRFDILDAPETPCENPRIIRDDNRLTVHFQQDTFFKRPKTAVFFEFTSPEAYYSPRHAVLANLYTSLLDDDLNEFAYDADIAGLHYSLSNTAKGMKLELQGYSDRLDVLLEAVLRKMPDYKVKKDRFESVRDSIEKEYQNFFKDQPYQHAMYETMFATEEPRWHMADYLKEVKSVTLEEVESFIVRLLSRMHVVGLIHGNTSETKALEMSELLVSILGFGPLPVDERFSRRVVQIPAGSDGVFLSVNGPNEEDTNSAIEILYQFGVPDLQEELYLQLIADILSKPFFHELRTVQQLGYLVFSGYATAGNTAGLKCIIQSTVASASELDARIETFWEGFESSTMATLSAEEFQKYVDALIARKSEPEKTLAQRSKRFWSEISKDRFMYDKKEREVSILESSVSKEGLLEFFSRYLGRDAPYRRKLASHVMAKGHTQPESSEATLVADKIGFRRQQALYPASYPKPRD